MPAVTGMGFFAPAACAQNDSKNAYFRHSERSEESHAKQAGSSSYSRDATLGVGAGCGSLGCRQLPVEKIPSGELLQGFNLWCEALAQARF